MPFKSRNFVSIAVLFEVLFFQWLTLSSLKAETYVVGHKGSVHGLSGKYIRSMALRSDGRYLFYGEGSSQFNVIDLLDMSNIGEPVAVDGTVSGLFLDGDAKLVVATTKGVQYFNVTLPYDISEYSGKFKANDSESATPIASCFSSDKQVFFLEQGSDSSLHRVRYVKDGLLVGSTAWSAYFPDNFNQLDPLKVLCADAKVLLFGKAKVTGSSVGQQGDIWVAKLNSTNPAASERKNLAEDLSLYSIKDFGVSAKKDQLLVLYNRKTALNGTDDSLTRVFGLSDLNFFSTNLGGEGRAISRFWSGEDSYFGFFIGKDYLKDLADPPLNQFLVVKSSEFHGDTNFPFGIRGVGTTQVGSLVPSYWESSKSDHYKYGISSSTGLALLTDGSSLEFTESPDGQTLQSDEPLHFSVQSDTDLTYEIRFDESADIKGTTNGLTNTPGNVVRSGSFSAHTPTSFEIAATELKVTKNQKHSLMIFAKDPARGSGSPVMRLGFRFSYDPPPDPVTKFRLGFGDQSVYVFFKAPKVDDIDYYAVYFSYNASDLDNLDGTERTFATGLGDRTITSPIKVSAGSWNGSYGIGPIPNGVPLYVRVQVVDKSGQVSVDNPAALSQMAYATLTLPQALGSVESCALTDRPSSIPWVFTFLFLGSFLGLREMVRRKKIGPSTSRNRRGGD